MLLKAIDWVRLREQVIVERKHGERRNVIDTQLVIGVRTTIIWKITSFYESEIQQPHQNPTQTLHQMIDPRSEHSKVSSLRHNIWRERERYKEMHREIVRRHNPQVRHQIGKENMHDSTDAQTCYSHCHSWYSQTREHDFPARVTQSHKRI